VDAVCINQEDEVEKGHQIQLMAAIYAKAGHVIVWLGEAQDDSDRALEFIRTVGKNSANSWNTEPFEQAILQLLKRPWFRRIWILQEVAAARHIIIKCGSAEIDGHAFCLGLQFLRTTLEDCICLLTSLIQGAIFRSGQILKKQERLSLDICSLGELVDTYHAHKAKKLHDKVYALLGMSSDDLSVARLKPDYNIDWKELMQNLVEFLIGAQASVNTWNDKEIAVIRCKGCILGEVSTRKSNSDSVSKQNVEAVIKNMSQQSGCIRYGTARWTLQTSAKSIQNGDLLCLLQGASKPSIIRLRKDHFAIIVIAADPPEDIQTTSGDVKWVELSQSVTFTRNFLVIWDWEISSENLQDLGKYDTLTRKSFETELEGRLDDSTRIWDIALILGDLGEYEKAEERLRDAIKEYKRALGEEHPHTLESQYGLTPLSLAARNGYNNVVSQLLTENEVNLDLEDWHGRTPLFWATKSGHEAVVKQLLATGKVNVNVKDKDGLTPLWWAVRNGYEAMVKQLLATSKVDVDVKDKDGRTPLCWAAEGGHLAVVERLLQGKAEVNTAAAEYGGGRTALQAAAEGGHLAVVERLLQEKAEVNAAAAYGGGRTALQAAAGGGHLATVERLLQEKAEVNAAAATYEGRTALQAAAGGGHLAIVERLLQEKAEVNAAAVGLRGRTALQSAAEGGHLAIVERLRYAGAI
jgi:ankyrin repeat protein